MGAGPDVTSGAAGGAAPVVAPSLDLFSPQAQNQLAEFDLLRGEIEKNGSNGAGGAAQLHHNNGGSNGNGGKMKKKNSNPPSGYVF